VCFDISSARSSGDVVLVLQRHFVIMLGQVSVRTCGRRRRRPGVGVAIVTSAVAVWLGSGGRAVRSTAGGSHCGSMGSAVLVGRNGSCRVVAGARRGRRAPCAPARPSSIAPASPSHPDQLGHASTKKTAHVPGTGFPRLRRWPLPDWLALRTVEGSLSRLRSIRCTSGETSRVR
jgi:hypothetical protein